MAATVALLSSFFGDSRAHKARSTGLGSSSLPGRNNPLPQRMMGSAKSRGQAETR